MDGQARAGIDLHGNVLRYAEVEHVGGHCRLLRLGSCDFDFDVAHEVLHAEASPHVDTLVEALTDVFAGSTAKHLHVALHPPGGYSFFTPLSAELTAEQQEQRVAQEVALLTSTAATSPNLLYTMERVLDETLDDGRGVAWQHVWAMPEAVYQRFEHMFEALPYPHHRLRLSMQAAAAVVERLTARKNLEQLAAERSTFALAIGWYRTHVEYALCRNGKWYFSHFAVVQNAADAAYFAFTLLKRLEISTPDVREVYVYGDSLDSMDDSLLEAVFAAKPERLNPIAIIDLDRGSLSAQFEAEAYAPCIGAAL